MTPRNLSILSWNARSFLSNHSAIINYANNSNIDILLISETWIRPGVRVSTPGYRAIHNRRDDGKGGVSILLAKKYNCPMHIPMFVHPRLAQFATIRIAGIEIVAVYIPPDVYFNRGSWDRLIGTLNPPFILAGDFNAHHTYWGHNGDNRNGRELAYTMDKHNLVIINDMRPTRIAFPRTSLLDLVLVSADLVTSSSSRTLDDSLGSDHLPVLSNVSLGPHQTPEPSRSTTQSTRLKYNKIKWEDYRSQVSEETAQIPEFTIDSLSELLLRVAKKCSPQTVNRGFSYKPPCPWWDAECSAATERRRRFLRIFHHTGKLEHLIAARRVMAETRRLLKQKKRDSFKEFCESLGRESPSTQVWKRIRVFNRGVTGERSLGLNEQLWRDPFLKKLTPEEPQLPIEILDPAPYEEDDTLNLPISSEELERVLCRSKDTAVGQDEISYGMLRNLDEYSRGILCALFNDVLLSGIVPCSWNRATVVPILKGNLPQDQASSYRPIALISCVRKTLESIIKNRLERWAESRDLFPPNVTGFRKGRGAADNLYTLVAAIYSGLARKEHTLVCFIDIKAAYDNVSITCLQNILVDLRLPSRLVNLISALVTEKALHLVGADPSQARYSYKGLPQGSPLSPLLFNVYVRGINGLVGDGVQALIYADDIALVTTGKNINSLAIRMNASLGRLQEFLDFRNLSLVPDKTKCMLFSRKRRLLDPLIRIGSSIVRVVDSHRFLGIWMDDKLTWNKQVGSLGRSCMQGLNMMRAVSGRDWGGEPSTLLCFYRAFVLSRLDYACSIYSFCPGTSLAALDRIQNQALRICLGALKSTPINVLHSEMGIPPLRLRRMRLTAQYVIKCRAMGPTCVLPAIRQAADAFRSSPFWTSRGTPLLVQEWLGSEAVSTIIAPGILSDVL
ncbi:PREDICTED: RNA-directed DNA polymerase from mobile element jockey-like, partial [Nicrophorus vespilloides]|uniref:RNA-directed DNA polymerase from mobile element jockey-like n=1 Tax=Nicrophorus vespilloides TaxID=110193 RepID=A0ABM1MPY8_NICVS